MGWIEVQLRDEAPGNPGKLRTSRCALLRGLESGPWSLLDKRCDAVRLSILIMIDEWNFNRVARSHQKKKSAIGVILIALKASAQEKFKGKPDMVPWLHWTILNWSKGRETGIDKIDVLLVNNIDRLVNGNKKTIKNIYPCLLYPQVLKTTNNFFGISWPRRQVWSWVHWVHCGFTGFTASFGLVPASTLDQTLVGRKNTY